MAEHEELKYNINIRDIKSSYIIKGVFSFLTKKQKLNMIIYNKQFQNMFSFDIEDYKKVNGKYRIGDKNGKGKEYVLNTNILIFEGEFLNGIRNGKGKEYYFGGKLKFEGDYLNGKRWNGKGYNMDGQLEFEISNGKGYIKEYKLFNGLLEFEGEFINGERNGKGKEYYLYGRDLKYEGEYLNGIKNGKGKEYSTDGKLIYEGEYLNGLMNGKGKEYFILIICFVLNSGEK